MRHLGSLIAGIIVAPLAWLLIGFGQVGSAKAFTDAARTGTYHTNDFIRPLIFLAVAGIVAGLIATLRVSPVGPLVAGVAYVGCYVALLIAPKTIYDAFAYNIKLAGQTADLTLPLTSGVSLVVGAAWLVAVVSVSRWRRWPKPAGSSPDASELNTAESSARSGDTLSWPTVSDQPGTDSTASSGRSPWDTPLRDTSDSADKDI